ncbi:MAG: polysaccharide biosynthesis C-terminal domain-containing protein [Oscillospiraceae bacterium]|nr:polysaccharide biosynthesis C-terminal domain-containing protein [Oscillospiraceae bacterium]
MNKYRTLASNMLILAVGQLSSKLLVYVMLRFYTDILGTDGYGEMTNIVTACDLLISVVSLSISSGVLRFALEKSNDGKMVFSIGINTILVNSLFFLCTVPLIGMIPLFRGYEWMIFIYVILGCIKDVCAIYVRSRYSVTLFAVDGIVTTVSTVVYNLLFLGVFHFGVPGYVFSIVLGNVTSIVFLNITTKLFMDYRPIRNDKTLRVSMLRYCIPLMPTTIMWWIISFSDLYMITAFIGEDANGLYAFAYKFPNLAIMVMGIFSQAWRMSAITERNSRTTSNFYSNTFSMMQTIMFLASGGIMLVLRPIIMPFFGSEDFQPAYIYVPLLLAAVIFQSFDNFLASIYEAAQKTTHSMISSGIGAVSNIVLNIVLIYAFGIMGAAIATVSSYVIVFVYRIFDTKKYLYMKVYWAKIFVNLALLAVMAWSIIFLEYGTLQNVINAVVFLVIAALNFQSCVQAVKLVLHKSKNNSRENQDKETNV